MTEVADREAEADLDKRVAEANGSPRPGRVVIVVPTSGRYDSRTARIAGTLRSRGHAVTILARGEPGLPEEETSAEGIRTIRTVVEPLGGLPLPARLGRAHRRGRVPNSSDVPATRAARGASGGSPNARLRRFAREVHRVVAIALSVRAQAKAATDSDPGADVYHGMAFQGIPVALGLASGSGVPAIYDVRDIYVESRNLARMPPVVRGAVARLEGRWARHAAATMTVNQGCAQLLHERYGVRPAVVMNCPPRQEPAAEHPERLRSALGLAAGDPLVLYHGGFLADRGLPEAIGAMAEPGLETAHLALLGWGEEEDRLRRLAEAPALAGRVHLLPAVPPAELLEWVASADVSIMVNQPRTLNERLSTPNKLFESLAAGVPVVSSDFPERRRIVIDDPDGPLGAVCDPTDPTAIADALRSILGLEPAAAADLRARCARAARERYSWESQVPALLATYRAATGRDW